MKQKNLILMVVAVGCGLVAAFLTSQMSAKPKGQDVQLSEVLVASKELPPGTRFTKDSLKDQVKRKKYKPEEVPERAVIAEEQLIDKQLTKTLRADDYVSEADLGTYRPIELPAGKDLITIRLAVDKVTPFVKPGSRIDLIGTGVTRQQRVVGAMILPNVLVMAVDIETKAGGAGEHGKINIQLTSLALNTEEALLVRMCETANVQLSYILRSDDDAGRGDANKGWSRDKVMKWLESQNSTSGFAGEGPNAEGGATPQPAQGQQMVKLPVPTEDLPAGTEITVDLIKAKFKEIDFVAPAPDNAVTKISEFIGKYIVEKVFANQFVPKSCVGDKRTEPKAEPKVEPKPEGKPEPKAEPKKEEVKKDTFDRTFTNASGTRVFRYERDEETGEWKLVGEVKEDGSVVPVQGATPPARSSPPAAGQPAEPKLT
jgi:Flp pilus assembly protein CpaB